MTPEEVSSALSGYVDELTGIISRFKRDRDGIHIQLDDDVRFSKRSPDGAKRNPGQASQRGAQ